MATLKLFEGVQWDGVNVFPVIDSAFDAKVSSATTYEKPVDFIRIGDPILVDLTHAQALKYGYGCLDVDSVRYFFTVTSIDVVKANAVYLSYTVDWFTTLRYSESISFGRCHLIKSSDVNSLSYPQAISTMDMTISSKTYVGDDPVFGEGGMVVSYEKDDSVNFIFSPTKFFLSSKIDTTETLSPASLYNGDFFTLTGILPANIINAWHIPFSTIHGSYWTTKDASTTEGKTFKWYESDSGLIGMGIEGSVNTNITTDNMRKGVITDRNGGIVYVVPYGRILTKIEYGTALSTTQCYTQLKLTFAGQKTSTRSPDKNVENAYVLIPCDNIDYINSTYLNWSMGLKGVEIEERRIQRNKSLTQGIGGSALTGALGATAGPMGAVAGVAGGLGGALLSYGVDRYYESDTQRLEDQKYQLAQDEIIPGSLIPNDGYTITAYQLSASADDIDRYNAEIANFGADCNLPLSSWTPKEGIYKFSDVEVQGNFPYDIKQNIRSKLLQGVRLIK